MAEGHSMSGIVAQPAEEASLQLSAPSSRSGFNTGVHGLRGLASMMVLVAHILMGTARHVYPHRPDYLAAIQHPWFFGTFGVEIFFVISGFVILSSAMRYDWAEFAKRRVVRIYPLFFVLSLVFVTLNALTGSYAEVNNIESILAGLLFLNLFTGTEQLTPNAWSLTFEAWFYVLTCWIVTAQVKRGRAVAGPLACMAAFAFVVAFPISIYFLIGIALRVSGCADRVTSRLTHIVEAASFAALVWFASRAHFDYTEWSQVVTPTVPPILVVISSYFYFALRAGSLTARLLGGRIFSYLGDVSYSLYLVHPFVYYALRLIFIRLHWFTPNVALSIACFAAAVIAGSLLVTHVFYLILERGPYQRIFGQAVFEPALPTNRMPA